MNKRIIVALDSNNINKTKYLVTKLKNEVFAFKIGYEFFLNFGLIGYNEIKEIEIQDEKEALSKYGSSDSGASLGDILGSALKKKG